MPARLTKIALVPSAGPSSAGARVLPCDGPADIAAVLCYPERTVKNVIYWMAGWLKLRNRQHAVAYAVRASAFVVAWAEQKSCARLIAAHPSCAIGRLPGIRTESSKLIIHASWTARAERVRNSEKLLIARSSSTNGAMTRTSGHAPNPNTDTARVKRANQPALFPLVRRVLMYC